MGAHSSYTEEKAKEICDRLSVGEPLAVICRDISIGYRTVYDWMEANQEFAANIARARESGYDHIADDCLSIADNGDGDMIDDGKGNIVTNNEAIQRSKLRVETRLKLLAKWSPKKYGDRVTQEIANADNKPFETKATVTITPEDAYKAMLG